MLLFDEEVEVPVHLGDVCVLVEGVHVPVQQGGVGVPE